MPLRENSGRARARRALKEALLWSLIVVLPIGVACLQKVETQVAVSVTPNGSDSTVSHTGTADLGGGSVTDGFIGAAFFPIGIAVTNPQFTVDAAPVATSPVTNPGDQAILDAEATKVGYSSFLHDITYFQSASTTIDDGDPIQLDLTQSDGVTGPTENLIAYVGTTASDFANGAPFPDLQASTPPTVQITSPLPGEAFVPGASVPVEGVVVSELNSISSVLIWVDDSPVTGANIAGTSFSAVVTWPSGPPGVTSFDVKLYAQASDSVLRTTQSADVIAKAQVPDGDGDGLPDAEEAGNVGDPTNPDTDGDGQIE